MNHYYILMTFSRCKHKHTDHDPTNHKCLKPNCSCTCFYSPWICNCNCKWSDHEQKICTRTIQVLKNTTNDIDSASVPIDDILVATGQMRLQQQTSSREPNSDNGVDFRNADLMGWASVRRGTDS